MFASDLSAYGDFLADFADDPDEGETSDLASFTSAPAAGAAALALYVSALRDQHPVWAGVDVAQVDWPRVSETLERHLLSRFGLEGLL